MIYVSTGGSVLPFLRLIKKMDEIAGEIDEKVIIQGGVNYIAKHAEYKNYLSREEADETVRQARLVISHAGVGIAIKAIEFLTPIIIVPRLAKLNEHFNDHQLELATVLEERKGIKVIYDIDLLKEAISFSGIPQPGTGRKKLVEAIREYVVTLGCKTILKL